MGTKATHSIQHASRGGLTALLLAAVLIGTVLIGATPSGTAGAQPTAPASRAVAVVVHADVPAGSLDHAELLDLYLGDVRFWDDGTAVVPLDQHEDTPVKEAFYDFLGRSITRMKSLWLRRRLAGEGDPPEALASDADVLARVAATPGAIGFVRADRARGRSGIRVVRLLPIDA